MKVSNKIEESKRKGNKRNHLRKEERFVIEKMLNKNKKIVEIAEILERDKSTISKEIKNNSVLNPKTNKKEYIATKAHHKAYLKQYWKKKTCLKTLSISKRVKNEIDKRIISGQSPENISGWIKKNNNKKIKPEYVSAKAIRKYIKKSRPSLERFLFWNRNRKSKKRTVKTSYLQDSQRKTITTRYVLFPNFFNEFGHWEIDFIVSKHNKYVLLVLVERLTKKVIIKKLKDRKNNSVNRAISSLLKNEVVKSITTDNDIAFTKWKNLEKQLNINIFFTNPFHSWEKGLVENTNRWIRSFLPKRTDFKKITKKHLQEIEDWLNNIPRRVINFKTSYEYYELLKNDVKISSLIVSLPKRVG